jgi:hypothetical protein
MQVCPFTISRAWRFFLDLALGLAKLFGLTKYQIQQKTSSRFAWRCRDAMGDGDGDGDGDSDDDDDDVAAGGSLFIHQPAASTTSPSVCCNNTHA